MNDSQILPRVHCIMMTTLDGKIGSNTAGVDIVDDYLDVYRKIDDGVAGPYDKPGNAWMCGRETSKLYFADKDVSPLPTETNPIGETDHIITSKSGRYFVTVDTKGALRWKSNAIEFFPEHGALTLIVVVTKSTPHQYLAYLQSKNISYIIGGSDQINFHDVLTQLHNQFNITTVLLEGGGKLNGSFIDQELVDEIHLLLLPRVLNKSDAPSLFDAENKAAKFIDFTLVESSPRARNSILLHYIKK